MAAIAGKQEVRTNSPACFSDIDADGDVPSPREEEIVTQADLFNRGIVPKEDVQNERISLCMEMFSIYFWVLLFD